MDGNEFHVLAHQIYDGRDMVRVGGLARCDAESGTRQTLVDTEEGSDVSVLLSPGSTRLGVFARMPGAELRETLYPDSTSLTRDQPSET